MKKIFSYSLILLFSAGIARAAVVKTISVEGNRRMDAESVKILTNVKSGDDVGPARLNEIAKRLQSSGYFETVAVETRGTALVVRVSESPIVNQITIEGNDAASLDDLKKEIRTAHRGAFNESVVAGDVQRMLALYQRVGLYGTKITPQKIILDNDRVNIVFEIEEGSPTYISDISFTGNKVFSGSELRSAIMSRTSRWWRFMTSFDVYDADRILYDQQLLRQFYARAGYVDFQILSAKGTFSEDRTRYALDIDVKEGAQFRFGKIEIKNPFKDVPDDELVDALMVRANRVYNIDEVEATISALRAKVAEYGYAFINVDVNPTKNDSDKTIALVFDIQKTNRVYIGAVNILGNVRTFDAVVEQLLNIRAGDPFSLNDIEAARQRIMRTQYFKSADMVPSRVPDTNLMNLDVRLEEQPTGELSGGLGWSNINGFMIDAGIAEKNFMGRGQLVQLRGSIAQYQKQVLFGFTEPYLFGRQLSGGFDVNYTVYEYGSLGSYAYDRDSFSVAGRLGWRLTDNWSQTLRLSATFDQNYDLHASGWQTANLYTLGTGLRYYNLDTNFAQQTHTGLVANLSAAYTGFGSTETFMRYGADITLLAKFFSDRWQFKSNLEWGAIDMMGGDYISRVYRYFLGGESLRGFDIAGVGSRNWYYQSYALGGLWKMNGSTQVNFPVFIPDEYQVKGFLFLDYGVLGRPPKEELSFGSPAVCFAYGRTDCRNDIDTDWRASWGFGVYWNTPMGPMNFSWGYPLVEKSYDRGQRFLLSFATQF
ncbi:MAG: outer membrane protein assembly factor BamA [Rickettsiales bacterium]|jgi:outer membrane protein insertion porin family|nr:outer membrane protein assembly factor BamA [Rickettsiales bacterium]